MNFALVLCEDGITFGGADEFGQMLINVFKREDRAENWVYFKATFDELPDIENANKYDAFIFSGSPMSVNSSVPFLSKLEKFIQEVYELQKISPQSAPKLVGLCFGHQLINKALGAKVINNIGNKFVFKQESVGVAKHLQSKKYYNDVFGKDETVDFFEIHSEEVADLPHEALCVGSSKTCGKEIILYGDLIITFQGHPEFSEELLRNTLIPELKERRFITDTIEGEFWDSMDREKSNRVKVTEMIREFISS